MNRTYKSNFTFTLTEDSTLILPKTARRYALLIYNKSNGTALLKLDSDFENDDEGLEIEGKVLFSPLIIPNNAVYMKSTGGDLLISVMESHYDD